MGHRGTVRIGNQLSSAQGTERTLGTRELEAKSLKSQAQGKTLVQNRVGEGCCLQILCSASLVRQFPSGAQ